MTQAPGYCSGWKNAASEIKFEQLLIQFLSLTAAIKLF
jgi:hypothetical protein